MTRFRIESVHEVLKDPGGHSHHWTILAGVLEVGTLRLGEALAIPRVGGGSWVGSVLGFERFREQLGESVDASTEAGRALGVAVWGLAPPERGVVRSEARGVDAAEARAILAALRAVEPERVEHCRDCRLVCKFG
jgi:hypothetical protein